MLVRAEVADCCFARHIKHNRQVADMRDMTLLDTGYFIGLLLLSLVLPLIASLRAPRPLAFGRSCTKTVSLGQSLVGIAGIGVLASSVAALLAAIFRDIELQYLHGDAASAASCGYSGAL